jgi:hypothetical protein
MDFFGRIWDVVFLWAREERFWDWFGKIFGGAC